MKWIDAIPPSTSPLSGFHPIISSALIRRGQTTSFLANSYINPDLYTPSPAISLPGMEKSIDRLITAIKTRQKICVWGDFDVDGQTATTILVQALRSFNAQVEYHIPVRATESHGVNIPYLNKIIAGGARLILTCDTGITSHEAIQNALNQGVEVIVTDHHDLPNELPPAFAIINPKFLPKDHPLVSLTGAGVAYKLAEHLFAESDSRMPTSDFVDLAALGLVSDLAVLTADTRYLAQRGIQALRENKRTGLASMYEMAELDPENINESHIGFTIAPRLNALGRLGDANPIIEYFLTDDRQKAAVMTNLLENYNAQRRLFTAQVHQAAEAQIREEPSILEGPILLLKHPSWPPGVLGIVAARLVEKYHKPAILLATPPGEPAHGSARSTGTFNITEAISRVSERLIRFGGHPMAAGFAMNPENIPVFQTNLMTAAKEMMPPENEEASSLKIDAWLSFADITTELTSALEALSPFGPGNPQLVIATKSLQLVEVNSIGRNKEHRKLILKDQKRNILDALWWNGGEEDLPEGIFDLAYTLRQTNWRRNQQMQVEVIDFRENKDIPHEISHQTAEVIDYRREKTPEKLLEGIIQDGSTILWAEGEEKRKIGGTDRIGFTKANLLIIWTVPSSPDDLAYAREKINPKTIWLIGRHKPTDIFEEFIQTLMGLIKFVINHENGKTYYERLAAATAQRLITVNKGIDWLVAKGMIRVEQEGDESVSIKEDNSRQDSTTADRIQSDIKLLLEETAAYRTYFLNADKNSL